jgi:hypothetical protein
MHFVYNSIYEQEVVYVGLVLHPLILHPSALISPPPIYTTLLFHFQFNALWLAVFYDANPLFLMRILFLFTPF